MRLEPFGRRTIVKRIAQEKSQGGIIIPDEAKKSSLVGVVMETGEDCCYVKIGDYILFDRFSGRDMPQGDEDLQKNYEDCLIMNEEDMLGKIIKEKQDVAK